MRKYQVLVPHPILMRKYQVLFTSPYLNEKISGISSSPYLNEEISGISSSPNLNEKISGISSSPYLNEEISGIINVNLYFYLNGKCSNFLVVAVVTYFYFQPNAATSVWFRRYMWGLVFLRQVKLIDKSIQSPKESNLSPIGLRRTPS